MPKFLHVFNSIEKHGPVFLLLDFALFSKIQSMQKKLAFLATSLGVYLFSSQHATAKSFFFSFNEQCNVDSMSTHISLKMPVGMGL